MTTALWVCAVLIILLGFAGIMIPLLPGPPLMFCGFLIVAWIDNFERVGWITLGVLGFFTLISMAVDFLAASIGARRVGASRLAVIGAVIGTIVGFFLGVVGLLVGSFVGAAAGEYVSRRNLLEAGRIGFAAWVGLVIGTAAKLGLAFAMLGIFITSFIL
jgi:uncharacterized protein YqgC (DUF456 family)